MSTALQLIQEKAQQLSPQQQAEVVDFIEFLLSRETPRWQGELKFDWVDGPDAPPVNMSSVELQHEAANLWGEAAAAKVTDRSKREVEK
jgi:hypothetical protein